MPTYTELLTALEAARNRANLADNIWRDFQNLKSELPPNSDIHLAIDDAYEHLQKIGLKTRRDLTYAIAQVEEAQKR